MAITNRLADLADSKSIATLELASYPADEAADEENIKKRMTEARPYFVVWENEGKLVGFMNGTLTSAKELTHESMYKHEPEGSLLCIHSVVVDPAMRRKGVGSAMLRDYTKQVKEEASSVVEEIRLICKENLIGFYIAGGFALLGPSPVVHGKDK
jgi:GNAT superfamily N-acetyltransferase